MINNDNIKVTLGDYFYDVSCQFGKNCELLGCVAISGDKCDKKDDEITINSRADTQEKTFDLLDAYKASSCEKCNLKSGLVGEISRKVR